MVAFCRCRSNVLSHFGSFQPKHRGTEGQGGGRALFNNKHKTIDDFQFYSSYLYMLPVQKDGYNCGIYVGLYMAMIAQNNIQYSWPEDMQQFRYKLALAIEHNDVDYFFKRPEV